LPASLINASPSHDTFGHACRVLHLAAERLAALSTRPWRQTDHQLSHFTISCVVAQTCARLARACDATADVQRFCSHSLHLLFDRGAELLRFLLAEMGRRPPGTPEGMLLAVPPAGSSPAVVARKLVGFLDGQAITLWNVLRLAAACSWFGEPAAVARWCPPGKLAGWLAAAAQGIQLLASLQQQSGSTGE